MLQWLDRNVWADLDIRELRENLDPDYSYDSVDHRLDSISIMYSIKGRLKQQNSKLSIDTILNTLSLYSLYKDSIIEESVAPNRKEFEDNGKPFPDNRTINFHMDLAYPESYELIKEFWEKTGKGTTENNDYFIALVKMGDLEARKIYDQYIRKVVETNGKDVFLNFLLSNLGGNLRGAYGTAKLIELLDVDQEIEIFADGDVRGKFNCEVMDYLISDIFAYNIKVDPVVKFQDPCEKHFEHLDKIKEAAQRLIEYYKNEEYYWMSNMPFYKE